MTSEAEDQMITHAMIVRAEQLEACNSALRWLRAKQRTISELCAGHPDWALWAVAHRVVELQAQQLDWCAAERSFAALQYASHLLTPERLDWCAVDNPWAALLHVSHLLTPERLDWCAAERSFAALQHASHLLTPERLDRCAEEEPGYALQYASHLLTPERLDWCIDHAKVGM